jgi:hypothetical protein
MLAGTFGQFGTVLSVKLKQAPVTQSQHCCCFIEMRTTAEARSAAHALNATRFGGRLMSVWRAARS